MRPLIFHDSKLDRANRLESSKLDTRSFRVSRIEDRGSRIEWSDSSSEHLTVVSCVKFLTILLKGYSNEGLGNINGEMCEYSKCPDVIKHDLIGSVCKTCREIDYICNMCFNTAVAHAKAKDMEND